MSWVVGAARDVLLCFKVRDYQFAYKHTSLRRLKDARA